MSNQFNNYLKCPHYSPGGREDGRIYYPACMLRFGSSKCNEGDITTCIYKSDPKIQEIVAKKKDRLIEDGKRIENLLVKLANAFGEPYR